MIKNDIVQPNHNIIFFVPKQKQMNSKIQQDAKQIISRIIQIRTSFPKTYTHQDKQHLTNDFKSELFKLTSYLKTQTNQQTIATLKQKLPGLQQQLKKMRAQTEKLKSSNNNNNNGNKKSHQPLPQHKKQSKPLSKDEAEVFNGLSQAIVKQKPNVKWDDVGGLDQAKKVLQQAVILPIKYPQIFVGERTPWRGILLYGPPGTGKTFLAKACATQMQGGTFFSVSASDLMSKYVGESQKTIRALFQMAKKQRPSIIFIDEIDSIAGQRSAEQNEVSRRVKTQFLIQMQGVGNECKNILVLGATNLPWVIDSAVRRRFQKRVYIPLPDVKSRLSILKNASEKNKINLSSQQMRNLAQKTDGYSGSDIANMINDALMVPVRQLNTIRLWKLVTVNGQKICIPINQSSIIQPHDQQIQGTLDQIKSKGYKLQLPTTYDDLLKALKSTKPSVSKVDLHKYVQWTKSFGVDG